MTYVSFLPKAKRINFIHFFFVFVVILSNQRKLPNKKKIFPKLTRSSQMKFWAQDSLELSMVGFTEKLAMLWLLR